MGWVGEGTPAEGEVAERLQGAALGPKLSGDKAGRGAAKRVPAAAKAQGTTEN